MKTVRFDSVGGASGDMIFASLLALGADLDKTLSVLRKALPDESFSIALAPKASHGLNGFHLDLDIREHAHDHEHEHAHEHGAAVRSHEHHGRGLREIEALIDSAALPLRAKANAKNVFRRLGEAEAKVHKIPLENVHFHEVGAVDSIIDILGSCVALDLLGAESVSFGPLPEGRGTFQCQHGVYPIPAPATAELLKGFEIELTDEPFELVTPTGAALLTTLPQAKSSSLGRSVANAISFGTRALKDRPNVLRATLFESLSTPGAKASIDASPAEAGDAGVCALIETNLDDLTPELSGALFDKLLSEGALDVWAAPVLMKKQRLGNVLSVLCEKRDLLKFERLVFSETGTLGLRVRDVARRVLKRRFEKLQTAFGEVSVKLGLLDGEEISVKPEFEDCLRLAKASGEPLKDIMSAVLVAYSVERAQKS